MAVSPKKSLRVAVFATVTMFFSKRKALRPRPTIKEVEVAVEKEVEVEEIPWSLLGAFEPPIICTMTFGGSCSRGSVPFDVDDVDTLNTLFALTPTASSSA